MNVTTQTAAIAERMSDERIFAVAYASFGGLAMLLAAIGLFGLASYTVTRRTGESSASGWLSAHRRRASPGWCCANRWRSSPRASRPGSARCCWPAAWWRA